MIIIPAVDIMGGKVVRLAQGRADMGTIYSNSPVETAQKWASHGVEYIHVVDLDGAIQGELKNLKIVKDIVHSVDTKIELGGGIRDLDTIECVLDAGVQRVCIGTRALDMKFLAAISKSDFRDMIVVSIDARDGLVRARGWVEKTDVKAVDLVKEVAKFGIKTVDYTDISRDGMLGGPNIDGLKQLLETANIEIIAAGGIATINDIKALKALDKFGLSGVIIGKALYEDKIDLAEAIAIAGK